MIKYHSNCTAHTLRRRMGCCVRPRFLFLDLNPHSDLLSITAFHHSSVLKSLIITHKTPQCTTFWHFFQEQSWGAWLCTSSSNKKTTRLTGMLQRQTFPRSRYQPSPVSQFPLPFCAQIQGSLAATWSVHVCVELQLLNCYTSLKPQISFVASHVLTTSAWLLQPTRVWLDWSLPIRKSRTFSSAHHTELSPPSWTWNVFSLETVDGWKPVTPQENRVLCQKQLWPSWLCNDTLRDLSPIWMVSCLERIHFANSLCLFKCHLFPNSMLLNMPSNILADSFQTNLTPSP